MWVNNLQELGLQPASPIYKLVTSTGSLSTNLKTKCKILNVQVISQQITATNNFAREVYLLGDNIPWVHAITTAPEITYLKFKTELDNLGTKLLGETLLYSQTYTRSAFEYALLDGNITRRSIFDLQGYEIIVQEKFLLTI